MQIFFSDDLINFRTFTYNNLLKDLNQISDSALKSDKCSNWSKSYQNDYAKIKLPKDLDFNLFEYSKKDFKIYSLLLNSLLRLDFFGTVYEKFDYSMTERYRKLNSLIEELKNGSMNNCLSWCTNMDTANNHFEISIYYDLLDYLFCLNSQRLSTKEICSEIKYIRTFLGIIFDKHPNFLLKNLNLLQIFSKQDVNNKLKEKRTKILNNFSSVYMNNMNLPMYDLMRMSSLIGIYSLEPLLKMKTLFSSRSKTNIVQIKELPVQIYLPEFLKFHSVYTCPVLKVQCNSNNPSMMISCGHIISKEALSKLSRNNPNSRFKCPYCPSECTMSQSIRVYI